MKIPGFTAESSLVKAKGVYAGGTARATSRAVIVVAGDALANGLPCSNNGDCASGLCVLGICVCLPAGLPCALDQLCCSGNCTGGFCT